jgi:hypothetical protein
MEFILDREKSRVRLATWQNLPLLQESAVNSVQR